MSVIADDERLYRRVPAKPGYCLADPLTHTLAVAALAFRPTERDTDGLSFSRAKSDCNPTFLSAEDLAQAGPNPAGYYVAELVYGDLRNAGIEVRPDPQPHDPGHALLPGMNSSNRKSNQVKEFEMLLATKLTKCVHGPFPGTPRS